MSVSGANRGSGSNSTPESSTSISPSSDFTVGSTGILAWHGDNANSTTRETATSMNDSKSNTWYKINNSPTPGAGGSNTSIESAIYVAVLSNGFTTSDSVSVSYSPNNVTAKAWTLTEAAPGTTGNIALNKDTGNGALGASTTASIGSSVVFIGDMTFNTTGVEGNETLTGDSDASNGSWSTQQFSGTGTGAAGMMTASQYKIQTTAISTQTYDTSWTTSSDRCVQNMNFTEVPPKTRAIFGTNNVSEATTTITFALPIASGSIAVLCVAADNNATSPSAGAVGNFPTPLTDSQSNSWTLRQNAVQDPGVAGAGVEIAIYTASITTPLSVGDTVGITYAQANVTAKCACVFEFSDATGYTGGGVNTGSSTGSPSLPTSPTSITNGHYIVAMLGAEGSASFAGFTEDTDTSNGSWSKGAQLFTGTLGATGMSLCAQYKKVTATATQSYDVSLATTDCVMGYVDLTSAAAGVADTSSGFFTMWY